MLRTNRAGKGPGGCEGWGLGSRNTRGPGVPPTPGLRGQGTSPGSPAGFLGWSGWGKCPPLLSCSSGLGGPLPPASPDLPSLPPMSPRTYVAWRGCLEGRGSAWELSRLPGPEWTGQSPSTPLPLLLARSSRLPLLISPASLLCPQDPRGLDGS